MAALIILVATPMLVALVALRRPQWFPLFDMAMTELKVRDVGSGNPPLVGLSGRIGPPGGNGSHPGPLAYWFMAPTYRLLGATSWALQVASVSVHVSAIAVALWIARRRGGAALMVSVAAALAVVIHAFGMTPFTEAWNPYLPVLWWFVFLLALWSIAGRDLALIPVAVFAGSLCAQTHLPYLAMVLLLGGALAGGAVTLSLLRRAGIGRQAVEPVDRRALVRWLAVGTVLGVVLWLPPLIDQLTRDPGNVRILVDHFRNPTSDPLGLEQGATLLLERLDLWALLSGSAQANGFTPFLPLLPGALLLGLWAGGVALAWRMRHGPLLRLHGLVTVGMVLGAFTASRIFGGVWNYLVLWIWLITALTALATVWSYGAAGLALLPAERRRRVSQIGVAAVAGVAVLWTGLATFDAADARVEDAMRSAQLGEIAPATAAALADAGPARYSISWSDPTHLGTQGWGLLLELERRGLDVVADPGMEETIGAHRVAERTEVDGLVHLAVGPAIERWRADPTAEEIAYTDHADSRRGAERQRLLDEVTNGLRAADLDDLAERVLSEPFAAGSDPRLPPDLQRSLNQATEIGYPVAVFLVGGPGAG